MIGYIRLEVLRTLRDGGYVIIAVAMPVLMYLVFSGLDLGAPDGREGTLYLMVGMAAFGACGAAFNNGSGVAEDAVAGWLRQLRVTPLTPAQVVVARAVVGMLVVLPAVAGVLAAGALINGAQLAPGQWLATGGLLWLGVAPIVLFALGNGYLLSAQTAQMVNISANLCLALVGGLWVPATDFPAWLATLSSWTPTQRYAELSWDVVFGGAPSPAALAVLGGWLAVFAAYAVYGYRRSGRTA